MERIIVAVGGTGRAAAERMQRLPFAAEQHFLYLDTDEAEIAAAGLPHAFCVSAGMGLYAAANTLGEAFSACFGTGPETLNNYLGRASASGGTGGWRMRAMLSFLTFLREEQRRAPLYRWLQTVFREGETYELVLLASMAGGVGSALPLAVSLFLEGFLNQCTQKTFERVRIFWATPGMQDFSVSPQRMQYAEANAYAALLEAAGDRYSDTVGALLPLLKDVLPGEPQDRTAFLPTRPEIVLLDRIPGDTSFRQAIRSYVRTVYGVLCGWAGDPESGLSAVTCKYAFYSPRYLLDYLSAAETVRKIRNGGKISRNAELFLDSIPEEKMNAGRLSGGAILSVNGSRGMYTAKWHQYLKQAEEPAEEDLTESTEPACEVFCTPNVQDAKLERAFDELYQKTREEVESRVPLSEFPQTVMQAVAESTDAAEKKTPETLLHSCRLLTGVVSGTQNRPEKIMAFSGENAVRFCEMNGIPSPEDDPALQISEWLIRKENCMVTVRICDVPEREMYVFERMDGLSCENLEVMQPENGSWFRSAEKAEREAGQGKGTAVSPFLFRKAD